MAGSIHHLEEKFPHCCVKSKRKKAGLFGGGEVIAMCYANSGAGLLLHHWWPG